MHFFKSSFRFNVGGSVKAGLSNRWRFQEKQLLRTGHGMFPPIVLPCKRAGLKSWDIIYCTDKIF